MKNNYKIVIVVASLTTLAVVLGGVSSTIIVHAADANEKADSQSEKIMLSRLTGPVRKKVMMDISERTDKEIAAI